MNKARIKLTPSVRLCGRLPVPDGDGGAFLERGYVHYCIKILIFIRPPT